MSRIPGGIPVPEGLIAQSGAPTTNTTASAGVFVVGIARLPSNESPAAQVMVAPQQDGPQDRTSEAQSKATLQTATLL